MPTATGVGVSTIGVAPFGTTTGAEVGVGVGLGVAVGSPAGLNPDNVEPAEADGGVGVALGYAPAGMQATAINARNNNAANPAFTSLAADFQSRSKEVSSLARRRGKGSYRV